MNYPFSKTNHIFLFWMNLNAPKNEQELSSVPIDILGKEMSNLYEDIEKVLLFFEERIKLELEYSQKLSLLPELGNYPSIKQISGKISNRHEIIAQNIQENIIVPLTKWKDDIIKANQEAFPIIKQLQDGYEVGIATVDNLRSVQNKIALQVDQLDGKEREQKFAELKSLTKQYQVVFNQMKRYEDNYLLQKKDLVGKIESNWITTLELIDMYFKFYIKEGSNGLGVEYQAPNHKENVKNFIKKNIKGEFKELAFLPVIPGYSQSFAFEKVVTPIVLKEDYFTENGEASKICDFFMDFIKEIQGTFDGKLLTKAKDFMNNKEGRIGFTMALNQYRSKPNLSHSSFKIIGDLMYVALSKSENDTGIGRMMFNMCQTYFRKSNEYSSPQYLTHYLKNHPIWKSIEFWENMINDAIDDEKKHQRLITKEILMNIVFGQLSGYAFNMLCMEVKLDQVSQFCEKYFTKYNLSDEYREMIKKNIESSSSSIVIDKKVEKEDLKSYSIIMNRAPSFLERQEKIKKTFFKEIKKK